LVAFATLPLYVVLHKRLGHRMRQNSREARRRMEQVEGGLHETITGIADIKSFTREREETLRFRQACRHYLESAFSNIRTQTLSLGTTALLTRVPPVLVLWAGGHLVLREELTIGALMAFYAYLEMIYNPLNRLSDMNIQLSDSLAAIDRLFEFFEREPEVRPRRDVPMLRVPQGGILYREITFGYRPNLPVLKDVDLDIAPGQRVALVGKSGAGKSTLVKLLICFHAPWQGRITIDGQDIAGVDLHSLRSQVALVQQDLVLFSGSIEDNILVGKSGAGRRKVMEAAERANAISFIAEFHEGFQTEIGERGVKLSGGQKQRIAIARAFLKNAPILILDESTPNLDQPSETLVYEALERLMAGRTTLIIAHRPSTVARADRIIVMDHGRVAEQGTHRELSLHPGGGLCRAVRQTLRNSAHLPSTRSIGGLSGFQAILRPVAKHLPAFSEVPDHPLIFRQGEIHPEVRMLRFDRVHEYPDQVAVAQPLPSMSGSRLGSGTLVAPGNPANPQAHHGVGMPLPAMSADPFPDQFTDSVIVGREGFHIHRDATPA
jgi:subfamily B ATP-binding cassette protein MsbA